MVAGSFGHWEAKWPGALALWPILATLLFLAAHNDESVQEPRWLQAPAIRALGLWSYSIYLWHWPLVTGLNFPDLPDAYIWPARLAAIALSVTLGWAWFLFIEKRFGLRSKTGRAVLQPSTVGAFIGLAAAASIATLAVRANGWKAEYRRTGPSLICTLTS